MAPDQLSALVGLAGSGDGASPSTIQNALPATWRCPASNRTRCTAVTDSATAAPASSAESRSSLPRHPTPPVAAITHIASMVLDCMAGDDATPRLRDRVWR